MIWGTGYGSSFWGHCNYASKTYEQDLEKNYLWALSKKNQKVLMKMEEIEDVF